ncbi:MAG TPA: phage integrase SAM-like domain-containing protein [Longimicrobium sp.]|nr:phage integrase SAM-like domain-containing protein [Longimicrobium sp.]
MLFAQRVAELRQLRMMHPKGLPSGDLDRIAAFVGYHIGMLETDEGRDPPTRDYLDNIQVRLGHAAEYFQKAGAVLLREITSVHVHDFMVHLRTHVVRGRTLSRTTQRQYMDALGNMLQRAYSEGRIARNWVRAKIDLPTPNKSATEHLELGECALLLEAARRIFPPEQPGRPIYALLGFLLLTGCIESEREGIELRDIRLPGDPEFPNGLVIVRPNASRERLKTPFRNRLISLAPQLAEILTEYLGGPNAPPGPLLFPEPGSDGSVPIGDWRKSLDKIAAAAGFARGTVRTRRFRVSWATHKLSTLDENGQPMTAWKLRGEMGHSTEQMIERRYGRYAKHRPRRPLLEYRWAEWRPVYMKQFTEGLLKTLTPAQHRTLEVLGEAPDGLTLVQWQNLLGSNPGTFFPQRNRLLQLKLVEAEGRQPGSRYRLTEDGVAVLALGATVADHEPRD